MASPGAAGFETSGESCETETLLSLSIDADGRAASEWNSKVDYATRVYDLEIAEWTDGEREALRIDAAIADCALLPRTYWVESGGSPRCTVEALALRIFKEHAPQGAEGGAEWWVQRRPNGRAEILCGSGDDGDEVLAGRKKQRCAEPTLGLTWHVDKDEELRNGAGVYLPPALSTVTYLSDVGAPTAMVDCTMRGGGDLVSLADGRAADAVELDSMVLAWPRTGLHLCFDGRLMHAVVAELAWRNPTAEEPRLTLLVNVWIVRLFLPCGRPLTLCVVWKRKIVAGPSTDRRRADPGLYFAQARPRFPGPCGEPVPLPKTAILGRNRRRRVDSARRDARPRRLRRAAACDAPPTP